jgi:predicted dehydrogenase
MRDPRVQIGDALQELRESLSNLRESVVLTVMRRNKIQSEVTRLERLITDLDAKIALAEQINNLKVAAELREERTSRLAELERFRVLLATAEAEAEAAKLRLPEEEARLSQQASDLQAELSRLMAGQVDANIAHTQDDFSRAASKIEMLGHEVSARAELNSSTPAPVPPKTAEQMLAELENRLGISSEEAAPAAPAQLAQDAPPAAALPPLPDLPALPELPVLESPATEVMAPPTLTLVETQLDTAEMVATPETLLAQSAPETAARSESISLEEQNLLLGTSPDMLETETVDRALESEAPTLEINSEQPLAAPPAAQEFAEESPSPVAGAVAQAIEDTLTMPAEKPVVTSEEEMPSAQALAQVDLTQAEQALAELEAAAQSLAELRATTEEASTAFAQETQKAEVPVALETGTLVAGAIAIPEIELPEPVAAAFTVETLEAPSREVPEAEKAAEEVETPEAGSLELPVAESLEAAEEIEPESLPEEETAALEMRSEPVIEALIEPAVGATETNEEIEEEVVEIPEFQIVTKPEREKPEIPEEKRIRVAAIGTGSIFRGAHLPCYPDIPQAQIVAFCDPDPKARAMTEARYESIVTAKIEQAKERKDVETAERLARDLETVEFFEDISEIIEQVKPDLVDICTQPFLHVPLSIQALEGGLNVMCEKPIARSWLETEKLLETVERTGKLYQHNENWLWDRDYYTAKKLVDAGAIGEPILMFLATAHGGPEGNGKFWNPAFGGGGSLLDNGIHAIGAAWYISGMKKRPVMVKAAEPFGMTIRMPNRIIDGRFQEVTVDDDAHILIRFEDPDTKAWTTAHVEGSWSHRDSPDTAIIGTTGRIVFQNDGDRRYAVVYDAYDREARRIETSGPTWQHWPSSFYGEILNMVECVRQNVPSISPAQFGADCSAIVGAAYLSQSHRRFASSLEDFKAFARDIASCYPNDPKAADDALVEALLNAVRNPQ